MSRPETKLATRHMSWPGIEPVIFSISGQCPANWATLIRVRIRLFLNPWRALRNLQLSSLILQMEKMRLRERVDGKGFWLSIESPARDPQPPLGDQALRREELSWALRAATRLLPSLLKSQRCPMGMHGETGPHTRGPVSQLLSKFAGLILGTSLEIKKSKFLSRSGLPIPSPCARVWDKGW